MQDREGTTIAIRVLCNQLQNADQEKQQKL
jgi:hypothetical protein